MVAVLEAPTVEVAPQTSTRTFGIELECEVPERYLEQGRRMVGGYEDRLTGLFTHPDTNEEFEAEVSVWVPEEESDDYSGDYHGEFLDEVEGLPTPTYGHWDVREDGSLSGYSGTMCEVVSPVLKGAEGLTAIQEFAGVLGSNDVDVNESCGLHVHVGTRDEHGNFVGEEKIRLLDDVFDHFVYAYYGNAGDLADHRANGGEWCQPKEAVGYDNTKYRAINIGNALRGGRTYEVRAFGPTTDELTLLGAVCMAVGIGEYVFSGAAQLDELPPRSTDPRIAMADLWERINRPEYLPAMPEGVTIDDVMGQCFANADTAARSLGCD